MPEPGATSDDASPNETSLSLLTRANRNESDGWRRLVDLYSPLVLFWCRRAGLQAEDAADVAQNVWQTVAVHLSDFERQKPGAFRGWLWTISRNKINDHFRRLRGQTLGVGGSAAHQLLQEVPEMEPESYIEESSADGSGNVLRRALALIQTDFEPRTWQAFWLAAVEGTTAREIAAQLQMSIDGVYQAKARVLRRLRQELAGLEDDASIGS